MALIMDDGRYVKIDIESLLIPLTIYKSESDRTEEKEFIGNAQALVDIAVECDYSCRENMEKVITDALGHNFRNTMTKEEYLSFLSEHPDIQKVIDEYEEHMRQHVELRNYISNREMEFPDISSVLNEVEKKGIDRNVFIETMGKAYPRNISKMQINMLCDVSNIPVSALYERAKETSFKDVSTDA